MKKIYLFVATFLYIGYLPRLPGTFASAAGLAIFYGSAKVFPPLVQLLVLVALFFLGVWTSTRAAGILKQKDPPVIVIDEIAGIGLALFQIPLNLPLWIAAFIIFRLLDILKPWPINALERLKGGFGIMMDDCAAGLAVNLLLRIWLFYTASI